MITELVDLGRKQEGRKKEEGHSAIMSELKLRPREPYFVR